LTSAGAEEAGRHDFDFWIGRWQQRNRRLRERLAGCEEWDEFDSTSVAWPTLDGLGNVDEFRTDYAGGYVGMSIRLFDPATRTWSIYWADSRFPVHWNDRWSVRSPAVSASSNATTRSTAYRLSCASPGRRRPRRRCGGSKHSRPAESPGRRITSPSQLASRQRRKAGGSWRRVTGGCEVDRGSLQTGTGELTVGAGAWTAAY
jgi:hypothetical protein